MTLKIHHAQEKRAAKHGIVLAIDTTTEGDITTETAQATVNGNTFTAASVKEALNQALLSLTEGGSAQQHERRPVDKKIAAEMKKARKSMSAKKSIKKKAKKRVEEGDEEEGGEDTGESRSVVKREYRKVYAPQDNSCGDAMAQALTAATRDEESGKVDPKALAKVAKDNGVALSKWSHLNIGMVRMNLGNVLRGYLRNGKAVDIDGQHFKPEKMEKE